jgi:hypothetical protein
MEQQTSRTVPMPSWKLRPWASRPAEAEVVGFCQAHGQITHGEWKQKSTGCPAAGLAG